MRYFDILKDDFKKVYPNAARVVISIVMVIAVIMWVGWGMLIMDGASASRGFGKFTLIVLGVELVGSLLLWTHDALERYWNG